MGSFIDIPQWKPLDFSGMAEIPQIFQAARKASADMEAKKAETDLSRRRVENEDRRLSHDITRQNWEDQHKLDEEARSHAIEAGKLFVPGSDFWTAATKSAALGNAVGSPYGVTVGEEISKPTSVPDTATPPDAVAAQFLKNGGQAVPKGAEDPLLAASAAGHPMTEGAPEIPSGRAPMQGPTESGAPLSAFDVPDPLQGPTPSGAPLNVGQGPDEPGPALPPEMDVDKQLAAKEAALPETRHVYANFRGSRIEMPKEQPSDVYSEPEYNAALDKIKAQYPGIKDEDAIKLVDARRKTDVGELGRNTRAGNNLDFREAHTLTDEQQIARNNATLGQSDLNNRRTNAARIAAAKLISMGMNEKTAVGLIGQYNQYDKSAQTSALMRQDQQGMRVEDRVAMELDPNNPNALNQTMAAHSISALSVSMGGTGVRVPVSVIHDVNNAYSIASSAENWAYKKATGHYSPEVTAIMNDAVAKLKKVSRAQRESDFQVWNAKAGYGSAWARNPGTRALVDSSANSVHQQLGLGPLAPPEDADSVPFEGDLSLPGAPGAAPPAAPPARHARPRAPAHGPAVPPPIATPQAGAKAGMVSVTNKKTGETKMVSHDEAVRMGAITP